MSGELSDWVGFEAGQAGLGGGVLGDDLLGDCGLGSLTLGLRLERLGIDDRLTVLASASQDHYSEQNPHRLISFGDPTSRGRHAADAANKTKNKRNPEPYTPIIPSSDTKVKKFLSTPRRGMYFLMYL